MSKNDQTKQEISFPEPFEHFNQEMASDIQQLRWAEQKLGKLKSDLEQAKDNIKDIGPQDSRHNNLYDTVSLYQNQIRETEQNITKLQSKTYGRFEQFFKDHDVEPELANQVMHVLDEKVYPDKYANRSHEEDKQLDQEEIQVNPKIGKSEITNDISESHEHTQNANEPVVKGGNYSISLFERKKEEKARIEAGLTEKTAEIDKNVMQSGASLNYQLKYQKPVFKEQPKEKLVKDFSKNSKDLFQDKE